MAERRWGPSSQDLERPRLGRRGMLRRHDRLAVVVLLDSAYPVPRADVEAEVVVHRAPAGDQDAEVGPFVAVVARPGDAHEEGLALAVDGAALVVVALVGDRAVLVHLVDAGRRRARDLVDLV